MVNIKYNVECVIIIITHSTLHFPLCLLGVFGGGASNMCRACCRTVVVLCVIRAL